MINRDGLGIWLAVLALALGYVWGSNTRMDVVWSEGYETGIHRLAEACGEGE